MDQLRVVFEPDDKDVLVDPGVTLVEAASQAGIILATPCGGRGTCGKCTVTLHPGGQEALACQYRVHSDLVVTVPPESRVLAHQILEHGMAPVDRIRPDLVERYRPIAGQGPIFGIAVDIGTTTVVAKLLDMSDGRTVGTRALLNPQTRFGDDVVSRIHYARRQEHLAELHAVIIDCINELIGDLCRQAGITDAVIYEVCVVGNTTMNHIFLGWPIEQLGRAPYRAHSVEAHDGPAAELGIRANPAATVHSVESIAGFVGSDTTAVALAVEMDRVEDTALAIDIGTNGELVLAAQERLFAASCAAGPALEGARIRHGSRAAEGAIEHVVLKDDDLSLEVIGETAPRSICGSGLIDAVAVLLDLGVVTPTGRFAERDTLDAHLPAAIVGRVLESDGQPAFCLAYDRDTSRPAVVLTQKDVREVQLAKAAIQAGIRILLNRLDLRDAQIDRVLLAGAFGNYIRPYSAVRIGLLPNVPFDRIHFVGNAAASGARMLLLSEACRDRAAKLARRIHYVEIAHEKSFTDVFADAMFLHAPHSA